MHLNSSSAICPDQILGGSVPSEIGNWIDGQPEAVSPAAQFSKLSPHDGACLFSVARSSAAEVDRAVRSACDAKAAWGNMPAVQRGKILFAVSEALEKQTDLMAKLVAMETGKSPNDARGEVGGAVALGRFMAGEGQRLYGRTTTSGTPGKQAMTVRCPRGVAGLIIAANTPIANVAWKVFPALICGNTAVLKAAEDTPATAWLFAKIAKEAGLPDGVLNVIQGLGREAGAALLEHQGIDVYSFTGSTNVGRIIQRVVGERLVPISLELGGKNPLVVCDDAHLPSAVKWSALSAFSNAGQRCAAASRIIIFDSVYEKFRDALVAHTEKLKVGPANGDDLGPVINERQLNNMIAAVNGARDRGAKVLIGGGRLTDPDRESGFYMAPTLIENVGQDDPISKNELFGPIACLYRVKGFDDAIAAANDSPYGLTSCIHTMNVHRALEFTRRMNCGVTVVNAGTYGSEPHMPFGGTKHSGNGTREPGTEALDLYSNLKDVYLCADESLC